MGEEIRINMATEGYTNDNTGTPDKIPNPTAEYLDSLQLVEADPELLARYSDPEWLAQLTDANLAAMTQRNIDLHLRNVGLANKYGFNKDKVKDIKKPELPE